MKKQAVKAKASHQSLRDLFAHIVEDSKEQGALQHVVALTYEFHDQQLLNLLVGRAPDEAFEPRAGDLKTVAALAPVVIYDARKTGEANLVPHFMELLPVKMPPYSCHHPKAYLVVREKVIHLVIGSMNLTKTGLFENREVFHHFSWHDGSVADAGVLRDFLRMLQSGHDGFASESLQRTIDAARRRLEAFAPTNEADHFTLVASGYDDAQTGLDRLVEVWRQHAGDAVPEGVIAVSPFFDKGEIHALAGQLRARLGSFETLRLITDAACLPALAKFHFAGVNEPVLELIPSVIPEPERQRIRLANEQVRRTDEQLAILQRKLHAKILAIYGRGKLMVYAGSANFTDKAWSGANRELGVTWIESCSLADWLTQLREGLSVVAENRFSELGDSVQTDPDEGDDAYGDEGYPDFVQDVVLEAEDEDTLRFHVRSEHLAKLKDYRIDWGLDALSFDAGGMSSALRASTVFARLLGGRNLRFSLLRDPLRVHYVPFRHEASLFGKREIFMNSSAADWMSWLLGHEPPAPIDPNEYVPEERQSGEPSTGGVDRDAELRAGNATIRMQAYLNLFVQAEAEFRRRAGEVALIPEGQRNEAWLARVQRPIETLARVLIREPESQKSSIQRNFKLGELSLLWRSLPVPGGVSVSGPMFDDWYAGGEEPVMQAYIDYCRR